MERRLLLSAFVLLVSCQMDPGTAPQEQAPGQPSFVISDGSRSGGNPEFFFLPPLVKNPITNPNWTKGAFNAALRPSVAICGLDLGPTAPESAVTPSTPCRAGGYTAEFPFGTTGNVVKLHRPYSGDPDDVRTDNDEDVGAKHASPGHFHAKWPVPVSADVYYRIWVLVGAKRLGYADVHSVANWRGIRNVNTGQFIARQDGLTLQIKFRIENRALCDNPGGADPCTTGLVALGVGGTVSVVTNPQLAPSGVTIPAQPDQAQPVTVTVQPCADFNPRVTDLPTFGNCLHITVEPALTADLAVPATVFVCDYPPDVTALTHGQQERVTLHRLPTTGGLEALPHAEAACLPPVVAVSTRLKGMARYLAQGRFRAAGAELVGLIGPTPLLALDRGGGGVTSRFSDFQFALPSKMTVDAGDGQAGFAGADLPINPSVLVTDLAGDPVANATVSFAGTGSVGPAQVTTGVDGKASVSWGVVAGGNSLTASGRGIGGADFNGPRAGVDPFMAIQSPFDLVAPPTPSAVLLKTGSQVFSATGVAPATLPVSYLGSGYLFKQVVFDAEPNFFFGGLGNGFALGGAGFGTAGSGCDLNANVASPWDLGSDILVRRQIIVPSDAAQIKISVAIDNDIKVYVDGIDVTASANPATTPDAFGYVEHEGCPALDSFSFFASVTPGLHEVAIRGRDRGGQAYLDVKVETYSP